ncbi:MAG TPA: hypothetical protein VGM63_06985 [Mucilaginibacter sp.]|jgi:hypothetical protein
MKVLIDIQDNKAAAFMEMIKDYSYLKAQPLSTPDAELLEEIYEIKRAFKNSKEIKAGKLKGRPADELLNEL